nr:BTAD domain-containing putative transcriptional regulator [Roseibium litorale]
MPGEGLPVVSADKNYVAMNPQVIFTDLMEVEGLLKSGLAADFASAAAIMTGPFLGGFESIDPHFAEWLQVERRRVEDDLISKALKAVGDLRPAEHAVRIEAGARFILQIDASHERAHQILISALLAAGRRAEAEQQLEICKTELKAALDVQPEQSTLALLAASPDRSAAIQTSEVPYATPGALVGESADLVELPELTIVRLGAGTEQSPFALSALDEIRTSLAAYRNLDLYDHSLTLDGGSNWELTRVEAGELGSFLLRFRHDPITACLYLQLERRDSGRVQFNEVIDLGRIRDIEDLKASCFQAVDRIQGHIIGRLRSRPGTAPFSRWCQAEALLWEFSLSSDQSALKILDELTSTHPSFSLPHAGKTSVILKRLMYYPLHTGVRATPDDAVACGERAVLLDPWQVFAQRINGWALTVAGQASEARKSFAEAERLNPRDPFNLMSVAEGYGFVGDVERAKRLADSALAKVSATPRVFYEYLGNIHFSVGEYAQAADMLSRAPNDSIVALVTRISALLKQGDTVQAHRVLDLLRTRALARPPSHDVSGNDVIKTWLQHTNMYQNPDARSAYADGGRFVLSSLNIN